MQISDIKYEESVQLAKQIINQPGYGAKNDLVKRGFWDESRDPDVFEFSVYATGTYSGQVEGVATVYARTEEEAKEKALDLNEEDFEWDRVYDVTDEIALDHVDEIIEESKK